MSATSMTCLTSTSSPCSSRTPSASLTMTFRAASIPSTRAVSLMLLLTVREVSTPGTSRASARLRFQEDRHVGSRGNLPGVHYLYQSRQSKSHILFSDAREVEGSQRHLCTGLADRLG